LDRVFVVFNPQAGKGRGARLAEPLLRALAAEGVSAEHGATSGPGDEARLTQQALAAGFRCIVAAGGDGTWSNVANALIEAREREAVLGLVPAGTGCDFGRTLSIPAHDLRACARLIRSGTTRVIDVGRVEGRHFLNVAGFGFDVAVIEDSWNVRYVGGALLYPYCALRQLHAFPGFSVELEADGSPRPRERLMMLIIANARVFGGGFRIAPGAALDDGHLDAVGFRDMGLVRRLSLMASLLRGTHQSAPEVVVSRARSYRLRFDAPPAYETDGEWNRARGSDLLLESVPAALRVIAPPA
jgi:diacylglycerol kinase (ATP)